MRNDSLINGGLIGFGLGFILASVALQRVVSLVIPNYASLWHFKGVIVIGVIGLLAGLGIELYQRLRARRRSESEPSEKQPES